jgi:hypothetical protein
MNYHTIAYLSSWGFIYEECVSRPVIGALS